MKMAKQLSEEFELSVVRVSRCKDTCCEGVIVADALLSSDAVSLVSLCLVARSRLDCSCSILALARSFHRDCLC